MVRSALKFLTDFLDGYSVTRVCFLLMQYRITLTACL